MNSGCRAAREGHCLSYNPLQLSPVLQADQKCSILYLSSEMTSLTQSISVVLSAPGFDWRDLIFEAACSKGLFASLDSEGILATSP